MELPSRLMELAADLRETGKAIQQAILNGNTAALPSLVDREQTLAKQLNLELCRWSPAERQPAGASPTEPAAQLQAVLQEWWRIHEQNRLLLQHAHRTVVELIALLTGSAGEPVGVYSPGAKDRAAVLVDRRA